MKALTWGFCLHRGGFPTPTVEVSSWSMSSEVVVFSSSLCHSSEELFGFFPLPLEPSQLAPFCLFLPERDCLTAWGGALTSRVLLRRGCKPGALFDQRKPRRSEVSVGETGARVWVNLQQHEEEWGDRP